MKVRAKAILIMSLMFSIALVILILAQQTTILAGFEQLERKETETQTGRAFDALNRELTDLDTLTFNNAGWDDTYRFIDENDTTYIENNWNDQCLVNAKLNLIVFINNSGQIVYERAFDTWEVGTESVSFNVTSLLPQEYVLWQLSTPENYTDGLIDIDGNLFLVASRPILKSDFSGPVKGALVLGRQVTGNLLASLAEQIHMEVNITGLAINELPSNLKGAIANLPEVGSLYVNPESDSRIAGYRLLGNVDGSPCAILSVSLPRSIYEQGSATVSVLTLWLALFFSGFGIMSILFLEFALLSRISRLTRKLKEMTSTEKVGQRLSLDKARFGSKDDELSTMSNSINSLLDKIDEVTGKLAKSKRFAVIGEVAVMVAHDLRNPLQGITAATDYLARDGMNDPLKKAKAIDLVKRDVAYCEKIVSDLLDYSREPKIMPVETDVHNILSLSLAHIRVPENTKINDLTKTEPKIWVDRDMMTRAFDNIVQNAIDAMPLGGTLAVKSESSAESIRIVFADTGTGIAQDNLDKLFFPLFTTKAKGMGLGLSICKRIVDAHKGSISVESVEGKGTEIAIELPR